MGASRRSLAVTVALACAASASFLTISAAARTTMEVGDELEVGMDFSGGWLWFLFCGESKCSKLWVFRQSTDSNWKMLYRSYIDCDMTGNYRCNQVHDSYGNNFPPGKLTFTVQRRPTELVVWLKGQPDAVARVAVSPDMTVLRVRTDASETGVSASFTQVDGDRWKTSTIPVNKTEAVAVACSNGGVFRKQSAACLCAPGFSGPTCQTACGPDRHGDACSQRCSGSGQGCRGVRFCRSITGTCSCAAGLQGPGCDQMCEAGRYGADCSQPCGRCSGGVGHCDPYMGQCYGGCMPGYHGPTCHEALTHLTVAPDVSSVGGGTVRGAVHLAGNSTAGSGSVRYLAVQYREVADGGGGGGSGWLNGPVVSLDGGDLERARQDGGRPLAVAFQLDGMRADLELAVRALLLDEQLVGLDRVPQALVRIQGAGALTDVAITNVTEDSIRVLWKLADPSLAVFVGYECLSVVGCPDSCGHSADFGYHYHHDDDDDQGDRPGGRDGGGGGGVLLRGLLSGARYRVTVALGERDAAFHVDATTLLKEPKLVVSSLEVQSVTNDSVAVRWAQPEDCVNQGGVLTGYRYQLQPAEEDEAGAVASNNYSRRGSTVLSGVSLQGLRPAQRYRLAVGVANAVGEAPESEWRAVHFATRHTGPSAPLDLAVYRWNRTTLWLRWRAPARPGGELLHYKVRVVDGGHHRQQKQQPVRVPAATSPCVAWPDQVCAVVPRRLPPSSSSSAGSRGGSAAFTETVVAVSAASDVNDQGDEAATTVGPQAAPAAVERVEASNVTATSLLLRWTLPPSVHGDLHHFEVAASRLAADDHDSDEQPQQQQPHHIEVRVVAAEERPRYETALHGLRPGASYNVTVWCAGSGGLGEPASLVVATKRRGEGE